MKNLRLFALLAVFFAIVSTASAQNFITKTGTINFESRAEVDDDVRAINKSVNCVLQPSSGDIVFMLLIKSFEFKKALMQEHFNENYMESEKFPKSTFKGKIENIAAIDFTKDGSYEVTISGDLTIHGITKKVSEKGTLKISGGSVILHSDFQVALADYNISIPSMVAEKISKNIFITCNFTLTQAK